MDLWGIWHPPGLWWRVKFPDQIFVQEAFAYECIDTVIVPV
jgi:hypothetical protein